MVRTPHPRPYRHPVGRQAPVPQPDRLRPEDPPVTLMTLLAILAVCATVLVCALLATVVAVRHSEDKRRG